MLVVRTMVGDCGYRFQAGHEYLLFANGNHEIASAKASMSRSCCSRFFKAL